MMVINQFHFEIQSKELIEIKLKNKSRIILIILVSLVFGGFFTSFHFQFESLLDQIENSEMKERKQNYETNLPDTSLPNWNAAGKTIIAGDQVGPSFNLSNIESDDDLVDDTIFSPGYDDMIIKRDANYGVYSYTGAFGTTSGGLWTFNNDYKYNDNKYLYLESTWGNNYPGWIYMYWGYFGNISAGSHEHLRQIRIPYEVMPDSFAGILDKSLYLGIIAIDDQGNSQIGSIIGLPEHQVHYIGELCISSGVVFDRVKAGGYIKALGVRMLVDEEPYTFTWINVDYAYIIYEFNMPDLDFFYELDYEGLGLEEVTQFNLTIDIDEVIGEPIVWLYNFVNSTWVQCGIDISIPGIYKIEITSNADDFFNETDNLRIRFSRYDYYDGRSYTEYHLKIDYVVLEIPPPDPPPMVHADQEIKHIMLTWDPSPTYGAPVIEYNIYRGNVSGGFKILIGTSTNNKYNDSAVYVGVRYYYVISASSISGDSANSSEVSGKAYDQAHIEWLTPEEDENIIFPLGEPVTFHFTYDTVELDDVELLIENSSISVNHGSVWNETSIDINEGDYIDGYINATIFGYNQSILVAQDSRFFTFVKITRQVTQTLNSSTELLGKQLYLILHDPHGDKSYSSFTEESTISIGIGSDIILTQGFSLELGYFYSSDYCGYDIGASMSIEQKMTTELGFDFRYEVSDATSLTSMQVTDDPDYIGPGYGDRYWGESWIYKWVLNATERDYSNGTMGKIEDPQLYYGIIRGAETYCSDAVAPSNWRSQNAIYNETLPVKWLSTFMESGGAPYKYDHVVTTTQTRTLTLRIDLGMAFRTAFGAGESILQIELSMKTYQELGLAQTYRVAYEIYDDEPTDFLVQGVGIDETFGTFIFNTSKFFCETSKPYEHGTYDYLPPEIDFPVIDFDSNDDGYGPTPDDSPFVSVNIFEEGGIQQAIIWYSTNNGTTWQNTLLTEFSNEPGVWYATLPPLPYDTYMIWYIEAWDNQGNNNTRYNSFGLPFDYTVILEPSDDIGISGFPLISTIMMISVAIIGIITIFNKKYLNK